MKFNGRNSRPAEIRNHKKTAEGETLCRCRSLPGKPQENRRRRADFRFFLASFCLRFFFTEGFS